MLEAIYYFFVPEIDSCLEESHLYFYKYLIVHHLSCFLFLCSPFLEKILQPHVDLLASLRLRFLKSAVRLCYRGRWCSLHRRSHTFPRPALQPGPQNCRLSHKITTRNLQQELHQHDTGRATQHPLATVRFYKGILASLGADGRSE